MNVGPRICLGVGILCFIVLTCVPGCYNLFTPKSHSINIGAVDDWGGELGAKGRSCHRGLLMAVEEVNKAGGIMGSQVRLMGRHNVPTPESAAKATRELIDKGAVAIIGSLTSARTLALAPITQADGIPLITPSATAPSISEKGDYVFRVCFVDTFQGAVIAKFMFQDLKARRVALLSNKKEVYSRGLARYFKGAFEAIGGHVVLAQNFVEKDDFIAQLTAIKDLKLDAIFMPGYFPEAITLINQARKMGITVPIVGGDGWDSPDLEKKTRYASNDCYYINHFSPFNPDPVVQAFVKKYRKKYQRLPDSYAALGYDAGSVLLYSIEQARSLRGEKIIEEMVSLREFPGVTGRITLDWNGNTAKSAIVVRLHNMKAHYMKTIPPFDIDEL